MTCSFGVCQCQGILHPAAAFSKITDAPCAGSPLSTAPLAQAGSPGKFVNFIPAAFAVTAWVSAAGAPTTGHTAADTTTKARIQERCFIRSSIGEFAVTYHDWAGKSRASKPA